MKQNNKIKVLVCMSGGVDSSVSAALLVRAGYNVTGAFMKQYSDSEDSGVCPWKKDRRDALRVAAKLGIPLLTLDFEKEYKAWVMEYMFQEYEAGRTPNPDVLCNKFIKFGVWLDKAKELGFDYLATGHYARLQTSDFRRQTNTNQLKMSEVRSPKSEVCLTEAKDKNKDQTYFLHQLGQDQLKHILFPIGEYTKPQVRKLAKQFHLPTAEREESMGICFVGEVPMKEFLQQRIKPKPGKIVFPDGKVVGEHEGLAFYTIGQRHGFPLSLRACLPAGRERFRQQEEMRRGPSELAGRAGNLADKKNQPLYVLEKHIEKNELVVGFEDDPLLSKKEIGVGEMHWTDGHPPQFPLKCQVRLRHRQPLQWCTVKAQGFTPQLQITFQQPQRAVTPGQFAVFYVNGKCLGGGVIL